MKRAVVCEHGYQVEILAGAVRHIATHGVCVENDAVWRELGKRPDSTLEMLGVEGARLAGDGNTQ